MPYPRFNGYEPHPRFWRDFSATFVAEAVAHLFLDWESAPGKASRSGKQLMQEVKEILRANAEMISALPVHDRPSDRASASEWICSEYRRKGHMAKSAFAQRDSKRCGDGAFDVLKCLEDTKAGKPLQRLSTMVARWYRESVLKKDARLHILARE